MLCNLGYDAAIVEHIFGDQSVACSRFHDKSLVKNTNYPSLAVGVQSMPPFNVKINKTIANFGSLLKLQGDYTITIFCPSNL